MTFYNEYTLCLGLIMPSFCGELLKEAETPWGSSVSRDFYTFFLHASHINSGMINELLRHNIELYNDLMCLNIMPELYKTENIAYKNIDISKEISTTKKRLLLMSILILSSSFYICSTNNLVYVSGNCSFG